MPTSDPTDERPSERVDEIVPVEQGEADVLGDLLASGKLDDVPGPVLTDRAVQSSGSVSGDNFGRGKSALAALLTAAAGMARDAEVPPSVEACEALLSGCSTVFYEVEGLADRVRQATGQSPTAAQVSGEFGRLTRHVEGVSIRDGAEALELRARLRKLVDVGFYRLGGAEPWPWS